MKRIRKFFKKLDFFGVPFLFLYKNKDKYSTSLGGLTFIIFCIIALTVVIYYFIPVFQRKNYSIVYYSMEMLETDKISFKNSNSSIAFGLDCPYDAKMGINAKDLFDVQLSFIIYTKDQKGNRNKKIKHLSSHPCNYSDFYNSYNFSLDLISIENYQCLDDTDDIIEGIWHSELFTYYEFNVYSKEDSVNHYNNINDYLKSNDCKLQFYYIDITIDLNDYKDPIKPYINSIFLQLDPTLFIKMNIFFMNQYFEDNTYLVYPIDNPDPIVKALYSRTDGYSLYKGLDRGASLVYDYNNYAKIYIRADSKRLNIKRKYQNLIECFADTSSLLMAIFKLLFIIFGFINGFYAKISISKALFFFREIEDNNLDILKKYKQIKKLIRLTEPFASKITTNNMNFKRLSNKDDKKNLTYPLFEEKEVKYVKNKEKKIYNKNNNTRIGVQESKDLLHENNQKINFMKRENALEIEEGKYNFNIHSIRNNSINSIQLDFKYNLHNEKPKIEKIAYSFNLCEIVLGEFFNCCMTKKMKLKKNLNSKANNTLHSTLDVVSYIKNMALLNVINQTIYNSNIKDIINFLTTSVVSVNKKDSKKQIQIYDSYSETDFDKFYNEISKLVKNPKKTKYAKKLISLSYQQLKEML